MAGSMPIVTYLFQSVPSNKLMLENCIEQLGNEGWKWYVDYFINWSSSPWEFHVFNPKLMRPVKLLLFEKVF